MVRTLVCLMLLDLAVSPARDARFVRQALEARYQRSATLKAVFLERYTDGVGNTLVESGTVYFARPGRMRWEYESPQTKLFLVDGKNVWFYVPADHMASRTTLKESSDWRTPLALLTGKVNLSRLCGTLELVDPSFDSGEAATTKTPDRQLRCVPHRDPAAMNAYGFQEVLFRVDSHFNLSEVVIRDPGGVETRFQFGNWEENIVIPESKFHFQPPPGLPIVDETSLAGEIH